MAGKMFLGGIAPVTTTEALQEHFSRYGTVVDAVVMYKDGKHRGFGFVTFEDPECVNLVLSEEQVIDGRTIDAKPAVPQGEAPPPQGNGVPRPSSAFGGPRYGGGGGGAPPRGRPGPGSGPAPGPATNKVFIGGLAQTTTDDLVRDYFSRYGNIVDCVVMKDKQSNRSRGFGFVQYDDTEPVELVMAEYADHQLDGKWVEVKRAVPQDRMPAPSGPPRVSSAPAYGGGYSPYGGGKGYGGPPAYAGRAYSTPPALYPPQYAAPPPHYGMAYGGAYSGYPQQPSYPPPGGAYMPSRAPAYRRGPY